jgi:hypothetical protein
MLPPPIVVDIESLLDSVPSKGIACKSIPWDRVAWMRGAGASTPTRSEFMRSGHSLRVRTQGEHAKSWEVMRPLTEPDHRWWAGGPNSDRGLNPKPCESVRRRSTMASGSAPSEWPAANQGWPPRLVCGSVRHAATASSVNHRHPSSERGRPSISSCFSAIPLVRAPNSRRVARHAPHVSDPPKEDGLSIDRTPHAHPVVARWMTEPCP